MSAPALTFNAVTAGYRKTPILQDVSFTIPEGEIASIIGPNGAGKTTLLRVITGLVKPIRGTISLFGHPLENLRAAERARLVGVVPQSMETPMAFTVEEVVMTGMVRTANRFHPPTAEDRARVERAMAYTDVSDLRFRVYAELSAGEKQRVVIAMVVAQDPRLVLMDEATSHLDINHRLEIMTLVERINRDHGATVLMISHDLNLSAEYCRRLILLDHGRIVADGAPQTVLTEQQLKAVYHCDVNVQTAVGTGSITVTPARRWMPDRSGSGIRIHVVGGGGSAAEIMRQLNLCEYTVTAGALNAGDTDTDLATALGLEVAVEKPFSPITPATLDATRKLVTLADAVVVAGLPFGPGNVANLVLVQETLTAGKPVFLMRGIETRDFTPDHSATRLAESLCTSGAREWDTPADLLPLLPSRECKRTMN